MIVQLNAQEYVIIVELPAKEDVKKVVLQNVLQDAKFNATHTVVEISKHIQTI